MRVGISVCRKIISPRVNCLTRLPSERRCKFFSLPLFHKDIYLLQGVVTRRPLELRLNHASENIEPWAKFEEVPNKKFTNFQEVKETINFLTDKICGQKKNIIDKPIVLNIFSHTCPDLTMVDLPGITRIPIDGQDPEIEKVTKGMAARYCGDPRTIILCVLPANADMTTSDGL